MDLFLKRKRHRLIKVLFFLFTIIIFLFSVILKTGEIKTGLNFADKIAHFFAYLILAFLGLISFRKKDNNKIGLVFFTIALCTVYGGLLEIVQFFIGRSCDIYDLAANSAGSFTGSFIAYGIISRN